MGKEERDLSSYILCHFKPRVFKFLRDNKHKEELDIQRDDSDELFDHKISKGNN